MKCPRIDTCTHAQSPACEFETIVNACQLNRQETNRKAQETMRKHHLAEEMDKWKGFCH